MMKPHKELHIELQAAAEDALCAFSPVRVPGAGKRAWSKLRMAVDVKARLTSTAKEHQR